MNKDYDAKYVEPTTGSLAFLIGFLAMLVSEVIFAAFIKDSNTLSLVFSYSTQTLFFAAAIGTVYFFSKDRSLKNTFVALGVRKPRLSLSLISIALPIASIIAFLPISTAVEYLFSLMGYNNPPSYANYTESVAALFYAGIGLTLFPAFGEEFLLRGALMRGLRGKGTWYAIFISALFFGVMHGSPTQFIYQFLIGAIMAYIVYLTDTIWYSVIFHFVNNTTVILYNFIYVRSGASFTIPAYVYIIMFIVGLAAVLALLWLFSYKVSGVKKPLLSSAFEKSEMGYLPYSPKPCVMVYVAFAMLAAIFVINTISGWKG